MSASGLLTPANFEFFARYVLAGFILMSVRSSFATARRPKTSELLLESIFLSLINQLVFLFVTSVAGWAIGHSALAGDVRFGPTPRLFAEVVLFPVTFGTLWGLALARNWKIASLRRMVLPNVHPTERAYDYAFMTGRRPGFVIVTYKDGAQVYGYFGPRSLAGSDEARSDIYLERLYTVGDDGQWTEASPSRSAILMLTDLRSIEFIARETSET